jgi:hypothetical protein
MAVAAAIAGCSSSAQQGAAHGASLGAVGGAVAGAVSSLIFGGNVVQGAAQGAAIGVASGAATGAMAGSMADSKAKQAPAKPAASTADLRKRIGDRNYATALLLAQCKHQDAIASAGDTLAVTKEPGERAYAQLIQGIAAEEAGNKVLATSLYPKIAQENGGSVDKARADVLEGVIKVQATRREHGLPACT